MNRIMRIIKILQIVPNVEVTSHDNNVVDISFNIFEILFFF